MRIDLLAAGALLLSGGAAFGQDAGPTPTPMSTDGTAPATPASHHHHRSHHHRHYTHHTSGVPGDTETPVDKGPDTPDANKAYQGGGVILQGQPGAPAPRPQATPPGQAPANAVPPT
jgi:hypothetical protein